MTNSIVAAGQRIVARLKGSKQSGTSNDWQTLAWCVDPETEIFTEDGWRRYDQIGVGTQVLALDTVTGMSQWEPVLQVATFDLQNTPMLRMKTQQHSSLTTMNHRWPTQYKKFDRNGRRTGEVGFRWKTSETLAMGVDSIRTSARHAQLPTEPKYSDAFVELVGWFWTEGNIRKERATPRIKITQSSKANPAKVARIRACLTTMFGSASNGGHKGRIAGPATWKEQFNESAGCVDFVLTVAASEPFLQVAPDRMVTRDFIRSLTQSQLDLFIDASVEADGHWYGGRNAHATIGQKDPERLEAFALACILAGRYALYYEVQHNPETNRFGNGTQHFVSTRSVTTAGTDKRTSEVVNYTGKVWCPVTPSSTWMARRDGTVYFTGNTLWETTPEVGYYASYISNSMSNCTLFAGKRNADGTVETAPDDSRAAKLVRSMAGGIDGQSVMLGMFGTDLAVAGEAFLIIIPGGTDSYADDRWIVLSGEEVKKKGRDGLVAKIDGDDVLIPIYDEDTEPNPDDPVAIRFWQPSPRRQQESTSPVRNSLVVLEELRLLNAAVAAIARSRITGRGVLLVPSGARFPTTPGSSDAEDSLLDTFIEVASTAIREPESAAATVPIVLEIPGDLINGVKWLDFSSNFDALLLQLRDEAIRRFAAGCDVPAEILLGTADVNHWTAWIVDGNAIKQGIEPRLGLVSNVLTTEWLRPILKAENDPDADQWMVWYDTSTLRTASNKGATALEAFKEGLISAEAARRELGFTEADAGPDVPAPTGPDGTPDITTLPVAETQAPPATGPDGITASTEGDTSD